MPEWSLDFIYFDNVRVTRHDLDRVSSSRPIGIMHASGHILDVNTKALELSGLMRSGVNLDGVPLGGDGMQLGELKGPDVMTPVTPHVGFDRDMLACDETGMLRFGKLCVRAGVTTATDLTNKLPDEVVELIIEVAGQPRYPACIISLRFHHGVSPAELIRHALALKLKSTDMMRLDKIKVVVDVSIQGFSARLREPGYPNGAPNDLWYISPEHLTYILENVFAKGLYINTHTNGDQATQLVIETMTEVLKMYPSLDHRFVLQHCQLADAAQFRKIAKLGLCVNLFAGHQCYWNDEHYKLTVGPERAERMNAAETALREGVPMAIHSDAP